VEYKFGLAPFLSPPLEKKAAEKKKRALRMGYDTCFHGAFVISPPLSPDRTAYLRAFSETRRCRRSLSHEPLKSQSLREAVGLPFGEDGAHCAAEPEKDHDLTQDYNEPPRGQPSLWCNWEPSPDGRLLRWNGAEKSRRFVEWLQYLTKTYLGPWGHGLSGTVCWSGEDFEDFGMITAREGQVEASPYTPIDYHF
jgi:hypothetical protein